MLPILGKILPIETLAKFVTNLAFCALAVAGTYYWHSTEVTKAENRVRVELAQQSKKQIDLLTIKSVKVESELKSKIQKVEDDKKNQKAIDNARINSLIASLQQRSDRPTGETNLPGNTDNCKSETGATGLQLYRSDGEFLTRYSGMARELQSELTACYGKYDEVKAVLDQFKKDNP
jgi:hypothetical protein